MSKMKFSNLKDKTFPTKQEMLKSCPKNEYRYASVCETPYNEFLSESLTKKVVGTMYCTSATTENYLVAVAILFRLDEKASAIDQEPVVLIYEEQECSLPTIAGIVHHADYQGRTEELDKEQFDKVKNSLSTTKSEPNTSHNAQSGFTSDLPKTLLAGFQLVAEMALLKKKRPASHPAICEKITEVLVVEEVLHVGSSIWPKARILITLAIMKVLIPIFCLSLCAQIASAQLLDDKLDFNKRTDKGAFKSLNEADTAKWKYGITSSLTINQTQVNNWQAGGNNNIGGNAVLGAYLDYRYKKHYWLTLLDASYGINRIQGQVTQKTQDYLEVNTKYGYALSDKWSLTVFGEGISQFTPGFDYKADPQAIKPISRFLAPAFFTEGFGLVWEEKSLGLYTRIAPITARQILVNDARIDETRFGLDTGQNINNQFGASCRVDYLRLLVDKKQFKLTAESRLSLFTDYADVQSMVVNWRSKLTMNVAKVFSISVLFHTIYDPNVRFQETFTDANGVSQTRERQKIQVLQNIGFGVGYTFNRKKGRNA